MAKYIVRLYLNVPWITGGGGGEGAKYIVSLSFNAFGLQVRGAMAKYVVSLYFNAPGLQVGGGGNDAKIYFKFIF